MDNHSATKEQADNQRTASALPHTLVEIADVPAFAAAIRAELRDREARLEQGKHRQADSASQPGTLFQLAPSHTWAIHN